MSDRVVMYEDHELHLTVEEYAALARAAVDDPVEAERLAKAALARQTS